MGPIGHCAIAMAAKPLAPKVPVGILLIATVLPDILAIAFMRIGIEGGEKVGTPWSHGLLMSAMWSVLAAFLVRAVYRSYRSVRWWGLQYSATGYWTSYRIRFRFRAFRGALGSGTTDTPFLRIFRFFSRTRAAWDWACTTPSAPLL